MSVNMNGIEYFPGMYAGRARKRMSAAQMSEKCIRNLEKKQLTALKAKGVAGRVHNCISFSRKIGVGALEIADLLSEKTGFQVIDREILEYIAKDSEIRNKDFDSFDALHTPEMNDLSAMLFDEKSVTENDYMRYILRAAYSIVEDCPTIFVGRGTHLLLPRENILAVRLISSKQHRVKRIAEILKISESAAERKLDEQEKFQKDFFKKNFRKKEASAYEFDLVINRDFITEAQWAADLVERAYMLKFTKT